MSHDHAPHASHARILHLVFALAVLGGGAALALRAHGFAWWPVPLGAAGVLAAHLLL
ncbi:MAG: hypothetical protein IT452_21955, partial [Planctomycetia bacterium]|nr:hypothetical protein [Planctomycetia bacterium]